MAVWIALAVLAVLVAYVRIAAVDPASWHVDLNDLAAELADLPAGEIRTGRKSAAVRIEGTAEEAAAILADLDVIALASGRTRRIAGSLTEGHVTWESRSLIWGFPDYTTARIVEGGLVILARSRFGQGDWGVNAARLRDWLSRL